ncbi:MAG TPA: sigma-70 family RNA polymerase sigma factor [Gemmataceae bacterium]|nr:sigma-70 family RNA polymerase sigma factor [Gemmataceae bacterium]
MSHGQLTTVLYHIARLVAPAEARQQSDRELLARFVARQEQAAFAALVERHGAMVLSVCRRVLPHVHDAEDACQAAFLVLARKAASIRKRDSLASWLHGVAYRSARSLQRELARHWAREKPLADVADSRGTDDLSWREMMHQLDAELERLPEKLRAPLVLCYLQGKTRDEAAHELGWTTPTLRGRLERGRRLLRNRLTRRGLSLSAALLAPALARQACAAMPAARVIGTVKAATLVAAGQTVLPGLIPAQVTALTEGVLKTMLVTKMKMVALVVMTVGLLGTGAATLTRGPRAAEQPQFQQANQDPPPAPQAEPSTAETYRLLRTLALSNQQPPQLSAIYAVAFSPDGKHLAAGDGSGTVVLWNIDSGKAINQLGLAIDRRLDPEVTAQSRSAVRALAFSPDTKTLAAGGDRVVKLWDLATGRERGNLGGARESPLAIAFSPDGRILASADSNQRVRIWDVTSGKLSAVSQAPGLGKGLAFSPDGKLLAGASPDSTVRVWDAATGKEVRQIGRFQPASLRLLQAAVAFSPDGKRLASSSNDTAVQLWDVATGKQLAALKGHENIVMALAFSPDGKTLATAGMDKKFICWDVATGTILARAMGRTGAVHSVAFSPDGRLLAIAGDNGTVELWERTLDAARASGPAPLNLAGREGGRFDRLIGDLLRSGKSDGDAIDALYLATLARFPAETEKQFAGNFLGSKSNRQEALKDLLFALTNTKEFSAHVQELQKRAPRQTP